MTVTRGTTNRNARGGADQRRRRREWLVETYRADVDLLIVRRYSEAEEPSETTYKILLPREEVNAKVALLLDRGRTVEVLHVCRCYRCGKPLAAHEVQVDRIIPGCKGGTYRRDNIRPNCKACSEHTGGKLGAERRVKGKKK